jgi:HlyD family secretion protein
MPISLTPSDVSSPFPELHSEEVHEIISRPPHWLVQWGITLLFGLTVLLGLGTWWIRFPDIVTTSFTLTATDAPRTMLVRTDGKLTKLLVKDGEQVAKGQVVAFLESTADHAQIFELLTAVEQLRKVVSRGQWDLVRQFAAGSYTRLGEAQQDFHTFNQQLTELKSFLAGGFYPEKRELLISDQADLIAMEKILAEQLTLQNKDLQLAADEFQVQEKLFKSKVISLLEYNKERARLLAREMPVKGLASSLIQNRSARTAKQKELLELENAIRDRRTNFLQSMQTLSTSLEVWKQRYVLIAPVGGTISFSAPWQEQQHLTVGQELMTVEPESSSFQGIVKIPQANIGKLEQGQTVLIKLDGFPFREYGMVEGKLSKLSVTPGKDSTYWGYVDLPVKLTTRYGRILPYRNGLKGQAEIITADRRLAERLVATLRDGRR